jgi:3-dehydroquinate dehydratase
MGAIIILGLTVQVRNLQKKVIEQQNMTLDCIEWKIDRIQKELSEESSIDLKE